MKIFCWRSISLHSRALFARWRIFYARCATTHQHHHLLHQQRRYNHMGVGTPLGNCQAWVRCPGIVSPSQLLSLPFFLVRFYLVVSWFSRIKSWHDLVLKFCFRIPLCNRVRELYIIKISVESRAWLFCHDLGLIEEKNKKNQRVHIDLIESNDFT